jgi:hypothetical protein
MDLIHADAFRSELGFVDEYIRFDASLSNAL